MRLSYPPAASYYAATAGADFAGAAIAGTASTGTATAGTDSPGAATTAAAFAQAAPRADRPVLQGEHRADVAVVGGGIAGLSAALHLAKRGFSVALLEARFVGYGASGRSGGQTIFGLAASQKSLKTQVGRDDARRLFDLSIEALDCTQALISDYGIDCDYRANHVHVATKPRHLQELQEWIHELHDEYEYRSTRLLNRDELQGHIRSERYLGGLIDSRSGHLHPLKYTVGLARAAEREGVKIFENTQVLRYTNSGGSGDGAAVGRSGNGGVGAGSGAGSNPVIVHTALGKLRCAHLILCGNAYLGRVSPPLARRIMGVGTYMIATEPTDPERLHALLPSDAAIADINWILDYFRRSADNRILFGGQVSYSAMQPPHLSESMRQRMVRVFPSLADLKVDYTWGGYLDITMSRAPDFGRLEPNVFYLQGFSGHGMSLTGLGGKLIAEAVAGTAERFDVFARIPHRDFPGGALLRRPSLVAAMLYYRLRDLL